MELNESQQRMLLVWLGRNTAIDLECVLGHEFDRFCSGETKEWRTIDEFGFAGKLWNTGGELYVTGWVEGEIGKEKYGKQKMEIERMNQELELIMRRG